MANINQQLETFQAQGDWLAAEKSRLLCIIRTPVGLGRRHSKQRAWLQLLELANRIAQFNREFTRYMNT